MWFSVKVLCVVCVALAIVTAKHHRGKPGTGKNPSILKNKKGCGEITCDGECDQRVVEKGFRQCDVVPDLIADPPKGYLEVHLIGRGKRPCLGNTISICDAINPPHSLKWNCNPKKRYTLFFIDVYPLGISRPDLLSQGILWLVVDIPGCHVDRGTPIFEYQQPLPLYGSGIDHYVYLIYEQPDYKIDWSEEPIVPATSDSYRYYRYLKKLADKYRLKLVAGNFFTSEFDTCIEAGNNALDPEPQYVTKAVECVFYSKVSADTVISWKNAFLSEINKFSVRKPLD